MIHVELVNGKQIQTKGTDASEVVRSLQSDSLVPIEDANGATEYVNPAHVVRVFTTPDPHFEGSEIR